MKKIQLLVLALAVASGLAIDWFDSLPNWDDTGITVFLVLIAGALWGYLTPSKPWLIALAVSIWIPLTGIIITSNYGTLIAFIPGFVGAYIGFFLKTKTIDGLKD